MHGFSTFCAYVRQMLYCANKFWSLNLKRLKPSFLILLLAYLYEKLKFVKIKQERLLNVGASFSELYGLHNGISLLYKYINCTVDKLLLLTLVTTCITNYSKINFFLYYQLTIVK